MIPPEMECTEFRVRKSPFFFNFLQKEKEEQQETKKNHQKLQDSI
jgi:hypothetical protein